MNMKKLAIGSLVHLLLFVSFMFLSIGATLGYGFKEDLTFWEELYVQISVKGMFIVRGPLNLISEYIVNLSTPLQIVIILLNSVLYSAIILGCFSILANKRKDYPPKC